MTAQATLEADIARQRDELTQTVAELQDRLTRTTRKVGIVAGTATGIGLVAGLAVALIRRRRH